MTHHSRVDWCALAGIVVTVALILLRASAWFAAPVLLALLLCAYPQSYETTDQGLVVRDALSRRRIPFETITQLRTVSPGRVRLTYGAGAELAITPVDAHAFLDDLAARCPHMVQTASGLALRDRHVEYSFRGVRREYRTS